MGEKVIFRLPPEEGISSKIQRFYDELIPCNVLFFKADEETIYIGDGCVRPRPILNERAFIGEILNVVDFRAPVQAKYVGGPTEKSVQLRPEEGLAFFHSSLKRRLPTLASIVHEPAVVLVGGKPQITKPGYDPSTQVYYWQKRPAQVYEPKFTFERLRECFSGVPFEKPEYLANVIAILLGAIVLDRTIESPLLTVTGNQPGVGKTKLCASIGLILTGNEPAPVGYEAEEMVKQVGACFREGQRFILIDNVTTSGERSYKNNQLATFLTQGHSKRVRELGVSRRIGQEGVLFALTANHCELGEDLAVRALMVKLYREETGLMTPYVFDYAHEHSHEIYCELLGLALQDDVAPLSGAAHPFFRFRHWLDFVLPRVRPHFGDLALAEAFELDEAANDLASWGTEMTKVNADFTFSVESFMQMSAREGMKGVTARLQHCRSDHARRVALSILLRSMLNRPLQLVPGEHIQLQDCSPRTGAKVYRWRLIKDGGGA